MRIETILNRVENFKPFVVGDARLEELDDGPALVVEMKPRKNGRVFCSRCIARGSWESPRERNPRGSIVGSWLSRSHDE
jgi:hypothetical protein